MKINANLVAKKITSNAKEAHNLFATSKFGEKVGEKIFYSLAEAFFLVQESKMEILDVHNKPISKTQLEKRLERIDKNFKNKYLVFKDLRKKGYLVKSGLKFGAEFRVYEKGKRANNAHSKWILFPVSDTETFKWQDFAAKNRVAHSTRKNLLIAIVDDEAGVTYYEVTWSRP